MTVILRNGTTVDDPRLDRLPSDRTDHLEKFPLTAATVPSKATPVLGGVNWYRSCFTPEQIKVGARTVWAIGRPGRLLGPLDGGHAICFRPRGLLDNVGWWEYYDQLAEGRCTEFAKLRMMSLLNRRRYDITSRWHYWQDQREDEWAGGSYPGASPQYEGTSVRAALEGLRKYGAIVSRRGGAPIDPDEAGGLVRAGEGIAVYRWCPSWAEVRQVTGTPDHLPGVEFLNSWGRDGYPHYTLMLDELGDRLLREDGEFGVVTDL